VIRSRETALIFYRNSAGVLQDVLQEDPKEDFGGLMVERRWESGNGGWMRM